jgi:hypothetical protein
VTSSSLIVIPMFSQVYVGPQLVISLRGGSQGAFLQLFVFRKADANGMTLSNALKAPK